MNSIKKMLANRNAIYGLLFVVCVCVGLTISLTTFRQALGLGDNATFFAFARNANNGEAPFQDFIHFRTPGNTWFYSIFLGIFGQQQTSLELGVRIETLVLYPLLFLLAAMIILKHKKNPLYVVGAYAGIALLPGVAQLRNGFGILAIAIYLLSLDSKNKNKYLFFAGLLTSVTFIFGQEIAVIVALCIGASELVYMNSFRAMWERVKRIAVGAIVGISPLVLYMLLFSSITTFIYYVTYYSFVLQPRFMNLPFPGFTDANFLYYLPFVLYWLCAFVLYANRKFGRKEAILLSFGILRLVTALSRSDFGHLVFAIPELFLIVPYFMISIKDTRLQWSVLRSYAPYGLALFALFAAGINGMAISLVAVPFVLLYAVKSRDKKPQSNKKTHILAHMNLYLLVGFFFVLFVYRLWPSYVQTVKTVKYEYGLNKRTDIPKIEGVRTDPVTYKQITEITNIVATYAPKTIFSFPIQPYYYRLAPEHASRYMTFEPQTTIEEQNKTIEDLQRTKPEVIIFDPLQAHGLSGSLWKISAYILNNYEVKHEVLNNELLWIMVPRQVPIADDNLVFRLYKEEPIKTDANGVQNPTMKLQNAIMQNSQSLDFDTDVTSDETAFQFSVAPVETLTQCGYVTFTYSEKEREKSTKVCSSDGVVTIPIESKGAVTISLLKDANTPPIVWNDPSVIVVKQ